MLCMHAPHYRKNRVALVLLIVEPQREHLCRLLVCRRDKVDRQGDGRRQNGTSFPVCDGLQPAVEQGIK